MYRITLLVLFNLMMTPSFAEQGTVPGLNTQRTTVPAGQMVTRRIASEEGVTVSEPSLWKASQHKYLLGYEAAATNTTGILGQNVITGGTWFSPNFGVDLFLGYTKSANGSTQTVAETTNTIASPNTKTSVFTNSGTNSGHNITLAGNIKYRLVQTDWFQFNVGMMLAFTLPSSGTYQTGSKTETYANAADTANKTVTETAWGTVKAETSTQISVGPRIGTEFYIKWFPHLAVGLSTGILTTLTGKNTTTTSAKTRTYAVTNGVEQTPTSNSDINTVATNDLGFRGTTFGLGGTTFSFTGTFTIRYIW